MKWKRLRHLLSQHQSGQGMVEYAFILVLVSIAVILGLTVFGEETKGVYCDILHAVDSDATCDSGDDEGSLQENCSGLSNGGTISGNFTLEGVVTDNIGSNDVTNVRFYIDGALYSTEANYRYCLNGGDSSCHPYNSSALSNGTHTFRAVATDAEGNTGSCEVSVTVSN